MDLDEYDTFDVEDIIFRKESDESHFKLLKALHAADVDALLPAAYFACIEYISGILYDRANLLGMECFRTLSKGRFDFLLDLNDLMARLSGDLLQQAGVYECQKEQNIRITRLDEHIDISDLRHAEGNSVVFGCLGGLCVECKKKLVTLVDEKRKGIWEKVPSYFGFTDDWNTLQAKLNSILNA